LDPKNVLGPFPAVNAQERLKKLVREIVLLVYHGNPPPIKTPIPLFGVASALCRTPPLPIDLAYNDRGSKDIQAVKIQDNQQAFGFVKMKSGLWILRQSFGRIGLFHQTTAFFFK